MVDLKSLQAVALVAACAVPAHAKEPRPEALVEARQFVLAICIVDRYPNDPLAAEAEAWAGGIVQTGTLAADSYPRLSKLARQAPAPQATQSGEPMRLASCVNFIDDPRTQKKIRDLLTTRK